MKQNTFLAYWQIIKQQSSKIFAPAVALWRRAPYAVGAGLLALFLSIWVLWHFVWRRPFDAWFLMPEQPVLVIEGKNFSDNYFSLKQNPIWKDLQKTSYIKSVSQKIDFVEKLRSQAPADSLPDNFYISLHITSKTSFDALFYVPMPEEAQQVYLQNILKSLISNSDFRFTERNLRGISLQEVQHRQEPKLRFTFLIYNNIFVGSYTSLLVEDVVRKISEGASPLMMEKPTRLPLKQENTDLLLYLNPKQLPRLVRQLSQDELSPTLKHWGNFAERGLFELVFTKQSLALEGFSLSNAADSSNFVELFERQIPQKITLNKVLPQSTAFFYHYTFSDNRRFFSRLISRQSQKTQSLRLVLQQRYEFSFTEFAQNIAKEFALSYQESSTESSPALLVLPCQSVKRSQTALDRLSKKIALKQNTLPYEVREGKYRIRELRLSGFLNLFSVGVEVESRQTYYTAIADYILLSNDLRNLRQVVNQYQNGEVLQTLNPELWGGEHYNFRFWLSPEKSWNILYRNASLSGRFLLQQSSRLRRRIQALSFAFKEQNTEFYTRLALHSLGSMEDTKPMKPGEKRELFRARLSHPAFTPPYLVANHNTQEREVLLQDQNTQLYLYNNKGNLLWRRRLKILMRSKPMQIDIYQNNKLQYLFYSNHRLQLKDRLGRHVSGFPIFTGDTTRFNAFAKIAPSTTPNKFYFLIANERGRVFMLDNKREWHPAWRPKRLSYRLAANPQYLELQKQDYLLLLQVDGELNVLDIVGNQRSGFPLTLEGRFNNPIGISLGNNRRNTFLTLLSDEGRIINIDLQGKVISQEQLYRPSSKAKFWLCQAKSHPEEWMIAVSDKSYLGVFDTKGSLLFEKNFEDGSNRVEVQFFSFDVDKQFIVFTDKMRGKTIVYDMKGKIIVPAFNSSKAIDLDYDQEQQSLLVCFVSGNILGLNSFYLP